MITSQEVFTDKEGRSIRRRVVGDQWIPPQVGAKICDLFRQDNIPVNIFYMNPFRF
jgi:hypothetical protein